MRYGCDLSNSYCPRCGEFLNRLPLHYDPTSRQWFHLPCWEEGERQLKEAMAIANQHFEAIARAREQAERFGFNAD